MSILQIENNLNNTILNYEFLAYDIIALSEFDSIIYYNTVKSKLSSTNLYGEYHKHRSRMFR